MAAGGGAGVITVWNLDERRLHTIVKVCLATKQSVVSSTWVSDLLTHSRCLKCCISEMLHDAERLIMPLLQCVLLFASSNMIMEIIMPHSFIVDCSSHKHQPQQWLLLLLRVVHVAEASPLVFRMHMMGL